MRTRDGPVSWWQLTPVQRALLVRIARDGVLVRLLPWEGRTVRSLVARALLRRGSRAQADGRPTGWVLTAKGRQVIQQTMQARS